MAIPKSVHDYDIDPAYFAQRYHKGIGDIAVVPPLSYDKSTTELTLDYTDTFVLFWDDPEANPQLDIDLTKLAGENIALDQTNGGLKANIGTGLTEEDDEDNIGKKKIRIDLDAITGDTLSVADDTVDVNLTEIAGSGITIVDGKLTVNEYSLPTATSSVKGGVKIGNGVEMVASDPASSPLVLDKLQAKAGNTTITVDSNGIKVNPTTVAVLGEDGKVKEENLPSYVDDVIEGYFVTNTFYLTRTGSGTEQDPYVYSDPLDPLSPDPDMRPQSNKIYIDLPSTNTYRWSGSVYVNISGAAYDIITRSDIDSLFN